MNIITISNTYTFFGNFSELVQLDKELVAVFEGWKLQTGKETLSNGVQSNMFRFSNGNKTITLKAARMDFVLGFSKGDSEEGFIKFVCDAADKVNSVLGVKGQRIAFSCVEFVEDNARKVLKKLNDLFNVHGVYGTAANELNVRVNHIKKIKDETYNSIVVIQDGQVTNNQTKEKIGAIFINKDVNTIVSNTEERFYLKKTSKYLPIMMSESKVRTKDLLAKLEQ